MKRVAMTAVAAACVSLTGCVESTDEYVLNPDGSGKVVRNVIFQPKTGMSEEFSQDGGEVSPKKVTPAEEVVAAGKAEIEKSEGVEVWKDARAHRAKDGRICFLGTAYFKDLAALKFHNGGFSMDQCPTWTGDGHGHFVLEFKPKAKDGEESLRPVKPASVAAKPPREVKAGITEARREYADTREMMAVLLSSMKMYMSFRLPGKLEAINNFKKDKDGNPCVLFQGTKMLEVMDRQVKDDNWMAAQVSAGVSFGMGDGPDMDDIMVEKLFGQKGPVRATVAAAAAPLFDYAAEVAAAKAAYPAVLKLFGAAGAGGMTKGKVVPKAGEALKGVKVKELALAVDQNHFPTVRVTAELPSAGMEANEGAVEKVLADNGEGLLPDKAFDREIHFPQLEDNGTTVTFDMEIKKPSPGMKSIREMAGWLVYSVSSGTKTVDLGITELAAGATGTEYRARITKIEASSFGEGAQDISLDLALPYKAVKSVQVFDAAGKALEAEKRGGGGFFGQSSVRIRVPRALPKAGRIVLELHDNIQQVKAPFILEDVALPQQ